MAYYTDYSNVIAFHSSDLQTATDACNAIANALVTYGGATLTMQATSGIDSDSTNYAEVSWNGFYIRFYVIDSSYPNSINVIIAKSANGSEITKIAYSFPYISEASITVKLRFYNVKSGIYVKYYNDSNAFTNFLYGGIAKKISTSATTYFILFDLFNDSVCYVLEDSSVTYKIGSGGIRDYDGVVQILSPAWIYVGTTNSARYIIQDSYGCYSYLDTGIVQIGDRYFYIHGNNYICLECNAPS